MAKARVFPLKENLRELLIYSKILQFCADIFAVFGLFLFAYIYFTQWHDNPLAAVRDPYFVVTMLVPFIPAAMLAYLASKKRRKIRTLLEESEKKS